MEGHFVGVLKWNAVFTMALIRLRRAHMFFARCWSFTSIRGISGSHVDPLTHAPGRQKAIILRRTTWLASIHVAGNVITSRVCLCGPLASAEVSFETFDHPPVAVRRLRAA